MSKNLYTAFYISVIIAAVRRIVGKLTFTPGGKFWGYAVTIPFCGDCIICGKYRTSADALKALPMIEACSGYKCTMLAADKLDNFIRSNCGNHPFSIFSDEASRYIGVKHNLTKCRDIVRKFSISE